MKTFIKLLRAALLGPFVLLMGVTPGPVMSEDFDTERLRLDVSSQIAKLVPENDPFMSILLQIPKRGATQNKITWFDQRPYAVWAKVSAAAAATDVTLTVNDAAIFNVKDLALVPATDEMMRVTGRDLDTNKITVMRGWGSVSAAAITSGAYILNVTNAMEENSLAPDSRVGQPDNYYNYVQEVRTPFDGSGRIEKLALVTNEKERDRLTGLAMQYHKLSMARLALYGKRHYNLTTGIYTAGGLKEFITTNVYKVGGVLTKANFDKYFCEPLFAYDKSAALLSCDNTIFGAINGWAGERLQTTSGEKTYGIQLQKYISPFGQLYLAPSQLFEKGFAGSGFGVHMKNLKWAEMTKTTLDRNIQENDRHGWKDEVWGEYSLEARLEETHAYISGVTG